MRFRHELRQRQVLKADQHRRSFHLGAFAVQGFDLQRGIVVGEHDADLEAAVLFEENVHVPRW